MLRIGGKEMLRGVVRHWTVLAFGLALVGLLAAACGDNEKAAPETIIVEKEVVVEKEVAVEVVKEIVVEKEVVVEATPLPALERYRQNGIRLGFVQEAPYGYINDVGECTGLDIDVAREVGTRLGIDVICVHLAWEGLVPGLLAGRVDNVPVGMDETPEKCQTVTYTDPYQAQGIAALVKEGNPKDIHSFDDFVDSDLVMAGSIGAEIVIAREEFGVPEERVLGFAEQTQAIESLKSGRSDAVVYTATFVQNYVDTQGKSEGLDIAVPFRSPKYFNSGHFFRNEDADFVNEYWNPTIVELKNEGVIEALATKNGFPVSLMLDASFTKENCCTDFGDGRHNNYGCKPE
jgi:polar amino acid transport system substrate-binding protein